MKKAGKKYNSYCKIVVCSVITYLAITLKFGITTVNYEGKGELLLRIINCFEGFSLSRTIYFPLLLLFYLCVEKHISEKAGNSKSIKSVSALFSFFIVFGSSFEALNTWDLVITKDQLQIMKAILLFLGWFIFLKKVIAVLFSYIDKVIAKYNSSNFQNKSCGLDIHNSESFLLKKDFQGDTSSKSRKIYVFLIVAMVLLIFYIPYDLISYPAIFMGDSRYQICQAFPELHYVERYNDAISLISEDVYITQHHPVMHTLLIHWCIILGDYIKSFNFGLFLYSMIQEVFLILCVAYVTDLLCNNENFIRIKQFIIFIILYFFGHPLIHRYMFLLSKDVIYSAFFLLLIGNLFILFSNSNPENILFHIIGVILPCIGMILFRNEAKYVLLLAFVAVAVINQKFRKLSLLFSCGVVLVSIMTTQLVYPALGFTPGSRREMFSVPFQQTARYVKYHSDEVTEEERNAINAVLDFDTLAENYNPNLSDPVKDKFNDQATNQDLLRYLKTWAKMLLKHPETYIQATMNNYYQYFFPGKTRFSNYSYEWSERCMEKVNRTISEIRKEIHIWNKSIQFRSLCDWTYNSLRNFPIASLLLTPAIYTWLILLLVYYSIYRRNTSACSFLVFPLSIIIITLLSPVNGYYGRYSYPLVVAAPYMYYMTSMLLKTTSDKKWGDGYEERG